MSAERVACTHDARDSIRGCMGLSEGADGMCGQVLIFSQFKIMLDVLEDFLRLGGFPFERIDGSVSQRDREDAINRYSKGPLHT